MCLQKSNPQQQNHANLCLYQEHKNQAKRTDPRVQKLIEEMTPFYKPEVIQEFSLLFKKGLEPEVEIKIIVKKRVLKNHVKTFVFEIRNEKKIQLFNLKL